MTTLLRFVLLNQHMCYVVSLPFHDSVITWVFFPHYWPFVTGIQYWILITKSRWCGALIFCLLLAWTSCWSKSLTRELRRHAHDIIHPYIHQPILVAIQTSICSRTSACTLMTTESINKLKIYISKNVLCGVWFWFWFHPPTHTPNRTLFGARTIQLLPKSSFMLKIMLFDSPLIKYVWYFQRNFQTLSSQ